ncbi:DegT/DnrJ/EryC1/StrS family aminotransferase [Methanobrevibacter sp.]|uniref:DegT/DnrJ/EryC1/StrS family aminotransferase n=1 Tax=Methanobrevibacter sp. TaxID=66852 RepID=UPI0026041163|nr:DegT/DnrJ/EryC1/StrS family aminotransferase [uncultured Methanobrevibacter sp.]
MINYPLATDTWDKKEINAINRVILSNKFTIGPEVEKFEQEFSSYFGTKYGIMVNSGSSANLIAISSLILSEDYDLNFGDEVIVPAVSWATTYTVLHQCGLKLRFVDIDIDTLNIDLDKLEKAINHKTKAVFAVNLLGNPNDFNRLKKICIKNELILIEDNCESMGAKYNKQFTGTFGAVGTFSTFFSHHMNTMEGGMVLTNDSNLRDIMISIRSHGWTRNINEKSKLFVKKEKFYEMFNFILPGYNLRPIEIEAAVGREQLKKLSNFIYNRERNGEYFLELFSNQKKIKIQKNIGKNSYFGFSMIFENKEVRDTVVELFSAENIECRPIVAGNFAKNSVIKYFDYTIYGNLKNSDIVHDCGLFIGNHHFDSTKKIKEIYNYLENRLGLV